MSKSKTFREEIKFFAMNLFDPPMLLDDKAKEQYFEKKLNQIVTVYNTKLDRILKRAEEEALEVKYYPPLRGEQQNRFIYLQDLKRVVEEEKKEASE